MVSSKVIIRHVNRQVLYTTHDTSSLLRDIMYYYSLSLYYCGRVLRSMDRREENRAVKINSMARFHHVTNENLQLVGKTTCIALTVL